MRFSLEPSVKVGDLLTSLSVGISVIAIVLTWSQEIRLQEIEQSSKIRNAAARILSKLERWQEISLASLDNVQPLLVQTSEMLADTYDVVAARDFLWKSLNEVKLELVRTHLDEDIESAYVEIYAYHPEIRTSLSAALLHAKAAEHGMFTALLAKTEADVLAFSDQRENYTTAHLGNALRATTAEIRSEYQHRLDNIMAPMETALLATIIKSDDEILSSVSGREH